MAGSIGATELEDFLVDFLNSMDVEDGSDDLTTADELATWAAAHELAPGELGQVRTLRTALRSLARGESVELPGGPVPIGIAAGTVGMVPSTVSEAVLASAVTLGIQGRLARVKLCHAHDCALAFYDRSRNGSRTWCEMGVCGNRAKARNYRARQQ